MNDPYDCPSPYALACSDNLPPGVTLRDLDGDEDEPSEWENMMIDNAIDQYREDSRRNDYQTDFPS